MEISNQEVVCYCKDCGQLDFAKGRCPKCGSKNIVRAEQDFLPGYGTHIRMMQSLYEQHFYHGQHKIL